MTATASPPAEHRPFALPPDLPRWSLALTVAALVIGITLRLLQYTAGASLWLDELALANNLADRSWSSLLREPLSYNQVAPPGFVLLHKLVYELAGANDHALRAYSLLAGLGSLGAITLVALRLGLRSCMWLAPMLLGLSGTFAFQSAQLKPYAGDVFFALAIVTAALRLHADADARRFWPAALGAVAPWFSFPAAFVLAGVGFTLLLSAQRRRFLGVVSIWAASTLLSIVYSSARLSAETASTMASFWTTSVSGFPPSVAAALPWLGTKLQAHLWSDVGLRGVAVWLGIVGVGAFTLWRRNRFALGFIAFPLLAAALAALLHRYPLGNRLSLWIAAFLVLLLALAAEAGAVWLEKRRFRGLAPVPGLAAVAFPVISLASLPPPYRVDHVKPVLAAIAAERQPNDWLFVYPGAWHAYRYYGAATGFPPERVIIGRCPRHSEREALRTLDTVRGEARVWVLFAHVSRHKDRQTLLGYADHIGTKRLSLTYPSPYVVASSSVDAQLYDFSDAAKLRSAAAETFPIPSGDIPNEQLTCLFGMVPADPPGSRTAAEH
ncbi:MAG: hypothetical protein AB1762_06305 [Gemmatimonadota bacterium]